MTPSKFAHPFDSVKEFHSSFGVTNQTSPSFPNATTRELRQRLLLEEYNEYCEAEQQNDLVEVADALADMIYIICGTADIYGIPLDEIFAEVHRSNMSKLDKNGLPIYREDGKILKGPNYFRPNITQFIEK